MAEDKIQMPSGIGGLVRYFDEYKSKIRFKPEHIIVIAIVIMVIVLILHAKGAEWLNLPKI